MRTYDDFETIINKMYENPEVIDNHTNKPEKIVGLVEFNNEEKGLGCMFDTYYYCINQCYIGDDNNLHCSTMSIGGVLWNGDAENLAKQLKRYNNEYLFEGGKIKCLHMADGSTIYPAA